MLQVVVHEVTEQGVATVGVELHRNGFGLRKGNKVYKFPTVVAGRYSLVDGGASPSAGQLAALPKVRTSFGVV